MSGCKHGGSTNCRLCYWEAFAIAAKYCPANVDRLIEDNNALVIENIQLKQDITALTAEVERLKDETTVIGNALFFDPPFDIYADIDIHERACDYNLGGEPMPSHYYHAFLDCCEAVTITPPQEPTK